MERTATEMRSQQSRAHEALIRRILADHGIRILGERPYSIGVADVVIAANGKIHTHAKRFNAGATIQEVYEWLGY